MTEPDMKDIFEAMREESVMVGGMIINVVELKDQTWLQCEDAHGVVCAIRIHGQTPQTISPDGVRRKMQPGDALWWQGRTAFWTPMPFSTAKDLPLSRLGYSHEAIPSDVFDALLARSAT